MQNYRAYPQPLHIQKHRLKRFNPQRKSLCQSKTSRPLVSLAPSPSPSFPRPNSTPRGKPRRRSTLGLPEFEAAGGKPRIAISIRSLVHASRCDDILISVRTRADSRGTADPFAEADEDTGEAKQSQNYIHIRIQRRSPLRISRFLEAYSDYLDFQNAMVVRH